MKSLIRLQKEAEEKKRKKEERERKKKEKELEKQEKKKIAHKKKLKQKQNKRCYAKRRAKELELRKKNGDEYAYFTILLTKNRKRIKRIGAAWWKTDAYKIYNEAIEKNNSIVEFPIKYRDKSNTTIQPVIYEIVLIKKVNENDETIARFRNCDGKFVDNIIIDKIQHIIVAKSEWLVEETFNVYGYHPIKDRKNYSFILNNIILDNVTKKYDIITIMTYKNKLLINYVDDFDFVTCRNSEEAQRLYIKLEKDIPKNYKKNVLFLGEVSKNRTNIIIDKMVEKTGWSRQSCMKSTT